MYVLRIGGDVDVCFMISPVTSAILPKIIPIFFVFLFG